MHNVRLTLSAKEDLESIPDPVKQLVGNFLTALQDDPFPVGVKKLEAADSYRALCGEFKILYTEHADEIVICAIRRIEDIYG